MYHWKEKVADKLSRILADSPSPSGRLAKETPGISSEAQGSPFSAKSSHDPTTPSLSSFLLSLLPSPRSSSNKVYKTPEHHKGTTSLFRSLSSRRWRSKNIAYEEVATDCDTNFLDESGENGRWESPKGNGHSNDHQRRSNISPRTDETSTSENIAKSLPNLMDESSFISPDLYEFLHSSVPNIVKGCQWFLLYSTLKHGISLRTLLRNSADLSGPCLLVVGDMQGAVFGGLLNCPLNPTAKRKYQGTNQTFVFTTIYGEPRLFRATGANRYYYMCLDDQLALGGGGSFALCLDGDLLHGTSGPCETFGNKCLAHKEEFELKNVELWGFTHSSRYLP
ncbi:unnamed protein product [Victoria cruziana]